MKKKVLPIGFIHAITPVESFSKIVFPSKVSNMFGTLKKFQTKWSQMSPLKKQLFIENNSSNFLRLFGIEFLESFRVYWLSYLPALMIIYYFSFAAYTIYYYIGQNDVMNGLKCLGATGIITSVMIQLIVIDQLFNTFIKFYFLRVHPFISNPFHRLDSNLAVC